MRRLRTISAIVSAIAAGLCLAALFVVLATVSSHAQDRARWPGPFPVEVLSVTDGDTVLVRFREGPCGRGPCAGQELSLRLFGIDAPEKTLCRKRRTGSCAACREEAALARKARAHLAALVRPGMAARARALRPDPYAGRIVGVLETLSGGRWTDAAAAMTEAGLAVAYDPKRAGTYVKSKPWCPK